MKTTIHTISQDRTYSQTFEEAHADQLVETTWAMINTIIAGTLLFFAAESLLGNVESFWIIVVLVQVWMGSWLLYQNRWYILARYFAFIGASIGTLMTFVLYGPESYSYFLFGPITLSALACFQSAKERFGLSALVLLSAVGLNMYGSEMFELYSIESSENYRILFIVLTMLLCYYMISRILEVNRDFMIRSKGITDLLAKQEVALKQECLKEETQTNQIQLTNRKLELEMNNRVLMERKLSSSNEQLAQFSFAASHDLKEPLRSISSFIQIIQKRVANIDDQIVERSANEVKASASKMTKLLDDLLIYSRAGKIGSTSSVVDLNTVLKTKLVKLRPTLLEKNVEVQVDQLPKVIADCKAIEALFDQILKNSIIFSVENRNPALHIRLKNIENGMAKILVADNGVGIEDKYRKDVFKLFYQIDKVKNPEGSGVGLAISRKIIHSFGGEIAFESNENYQGVALVFSLPVLL